MLFFVLQGQGKHDYLSLVYAFIIQTIFNVNVIWHISAVVVVLCFIFCDIFLADCKVVQHTTCCYDHLGLVWTLYIKELQTVEAAFQSANGTFHNTPDQRVHLVESSLPSCQRPIITEGFQ